MRAATSRIFVGVAGWSYQDWEGTVYPVVKKRGFSELAYLSDYVDAMEVNSTFYRPVAPATAVKWVSQVEAHPHFIFTAKLHQRFTHNREEQWTKSEARQFKDGLTPIREAGRFGALLMQFPWSFKAGDEEFDWLDRLAEEFKDFPTAIEVRHASWNDDEALSFLKKRRLNFCNIDQPLFGKSLKRTNIVTGPIAYYRFHGRNAKAWFNPEAGRDQRYDYLYSEEELKPWAEDIALTSQHVKKLFVIGNNHYKGQEVVNALQLKAQLTGEDVSVPEPLLKHYPVLKGIARTPVMQKSIGYQ